MRIIHLIESDGGSSDFVYLLASHLSHVQHTVLCGKRAWLAFENLKLQLGDAFPKNLSTVFWSSAERELSPIKDFIGVISLVKLLKNYPAQDTIHLHSSKAGFLGRLACRFLGRKNIIYTTHAVSFLRRDVPKWKLSLYIYLEKAAARLGGKIVCCSQSESAEMNKHGFETISIPNGVTINQVFESNSYSDSSNKIIVATVGRITIQKNPKLFNSIAAKFVDQPNIVFKWIGMGELKHELTSSNIQVTGWLGKTELYNQLKEVDVYLSVASWEGMPISVLEAMALAKPLVLSACVGNVDLVSKGDNGYIFDTEEEAIVSLNELFGNKSKRQILGDCSRKICEEEYDIRITANKYNMLYEACGKSGAN